MNPPDQPTPTLAPTPRTDAAYFATGATMYSLAGEMKLIERELAGACSLNALACRKWDAAETKLAAAKEECERLKALGSWMHTCLNHTDAERKAGVGCWCCATAELTRLRAEVERWKTVAAEMSQEREHNANEASRLRAEVERRNDIINRASVQFFHDGSDGETAAKMLTVLNEAKP
jgi:hypothetical protein